MNVSCPQCSTIYRVDPDKVPEGGVNARCASCSAVFRVDSEPVAGQSPPPATEAAGRDVAPAQAGPQREESAREPATIGESAPAASPTAPAAGPAESPAPDRGEEGAASAAGASESSGPDGPVVRPPSPFGSADPRARAKRLARALVSDILVYHPERRERSRRDGTLRQEFREEIRKSWEEYVAQVGAGFAKETPFFRDALNEILAGGDRVF